MTTRDDALQAFIRTCGWDDAHAKVIAGDASNRRYLRLAKASGETAILMDAPPDKGEDVRPFVEIATFLSETGLSAPAILACDETAGFLLIEDLGDDLFARLLETSPGMETRLYSTATEILLHLHKAAPPANLSTYSVPVMSGLAALACEWYAAALGQDDPKARARLESEMAGALSLLDDLDEVLIQRDYHAENLIWLPNRAGVARVGLLDFQDAMLGHRAYDLVSLLQDARRDVPNEIENEMITRYVTSWGGNPAAFDAAYHVLGAQRNLRIIGVFARLCLRDGKAHYVDLIPRVWAYLMRDLEHASLGALRAVIDEVLPPPDANALQRLKSKCATLST